MSAHNNRMPGIVLRVPNPISAAKLVPPKGTWKLLRSAMPTIVCEEQSHSSPDSNLQDSHFFFPHGCEAMPLYRTHNSGLIFPGDKVQKYRGPREPCDDYST